jgi:hypothetical protein
VASGAVAAPGIATAAGLFGKAGSDGFEYRSAATAAGSISGVVPAIAVLAAGFAGNA